MNLVIDIGNTNCKMAVFQKNKLIHFEKFNILTKNILQKIFEHFNKEEKIKNSIISNSGDFDESLIAFLQNNSNYIAFSNESKVPITLKYKTPNTLGLDRICNVVGATLMNNAAYNTLVIDTGTCITFNFVNQQNEFLGGSIAPGLKMRFEAMHHFTDKLPLEKIPNAAINLIGDDTKTSLQSGATNGIIAEISGMIDNYKNKYDYLAIYITGGGTNFFAKHLKYKIFAVPNLGLFGLNKILNYGIEA